MRRYVVHEPARCTVRPFAAIEIGDRLAHAGRIAINLIYINVDHTGGAGALTHTKYGTSLATQHYM
jgi:hypothetical protein